MPIWGTTVQQAVTSLTEGKECMGKIRKGDWAKKADGTPYPIDLDYFRFLWEDQRFDNTHDPSLDPVREAAKQIFGEKPVRFDNIRLTTLDPQQDAWMEKWAKTKKGTPYLEVRCDKHTQIAHYVYDKDHPGLSRDPIPCAIPPGSPPGTKCPLKCDPIFRLGIYLPDLIAATGKVGYFILELSTDREIKNVIAAINWAWNLADQKGFQRSAIPFAISRSDAPTNVPDITGMQMKSLVRLFPDPEWVKEMMQAPDIESEDYDALPAPEDAVIEGQLTEGSMSKDEELDSLAQFHAEAADFRALAIMLGILREQQNKLGLEALKAEVMRLAADPDIQQPLRSVIVTVDKREDWNKGQPFAIFDCGFGDVHATNLSRLPESIQTAPYGVKLELPHPYLVRFQAAKKAGIYVATDYGEESSVVIE